MSLCPPPPQLSRPWYYVKFKSFQAHTHTSLLRRQRPSGLVLLFHIYTYRPLFSSSHLIQEQFFQISRLYLLSDAHDSISSLLWVLVPSVITLPIKLLLPLYLPRCSRYANSKLQKFKQVNWRPFDFTFFLFYFLLMFFYFKLPISSLSLYDSTTSKFFPCHLMGVCITTEKGFFAKPLALER